MEYFLYAVLHSMAEASRQWIVAIRPVIVAYGDADGARYEHALELFRAKGGGKMGGLHGLPKSRLAILPGTTHIRMIRRTEWLIPMITDFLDSDLNETPPAFQGVRLFHSVAMNCSGQACA